LECDRRCGDLCAELCSRNHTDRELLELEAGVSPFYTRNATEWDTDLLFKKPWTISPKAEFMLGIGPEWVYLRQNGKTTNSIAGEVAGDFMFWPAHKHCFGWFSRIRPPN
jgi:hypothetical protein